MEGLERRALVMLVVVGLLFVRANALYPVSTWLTAIYIFGLACLAAASVLLVVVIAPAIYIGRWDSERQRLLFYAFALLVSDIVVTAVIFALRRVRDERSRRRQLNHLDPTALRVTFPHSGAGERRWRPQSG